MAFSDKIDGYNVTVSFWNEKPTFRVDSVGDFDSYEKCLKGIQAYDLALRKDFANAGAYMVPRFYSGNRELREVQVTSVVDDKTAWIKTAQGKREKVQREDLFANKAEVENAMAIEAECRAKTTAVWESAARWQPTAKASK